MALKHNLSSRELAYPPQTWDFEDDFPDFPRWDMLVPWRVDLLETMPEKSSNKIFPKWWWKMVIYHGIQVKNHLKQIQDKGYPSEV